MAEQTYAAFVASRTSAGALGGTDDLTIVRGGSTYKSALSAVATYMATAMAALAVSATTIELGHATDTTISRASAGRIAVEGSNVLMASDVGVTVAAYDADLASWAGVTRAAGFDAFVATPSSANLAALLTDELGSDKLVFSAGTLAVAAGKTLTASNTLTLTATDGSTLAIGAGGTLGSAAYKATGTSGANIPLLNGANTWSAAQNITAGSGFTPTDAALVVQAPGSAGSGPYVVLHYANASPTAGDVWGLRYFGKDSAANDQVYASVNCAIMDPTSTSEDSELRFATIVAGAFANRLVIGATADFSVSSIFTDATAGIRIRNNAAAIYFENTAGTRGGYLTTPSTGTWILDNETGGGTLNIRMPGGTTFGGPTGGAKGTGTINAIALYDDNTLLTDLVLDLAVAGSFDIARYAKHPIAAEVAAWWFNPDQYAEFWKANRHLPGMVQWTDEAHKPSTGALTTRLTAVVETHAVLLANDNDRIKALEAEVSTLKALLAA